MGGRSDWGGRTRGVGLGRSDWDRTRWLVIFPKFHFDLLTFHPTWTSFIQRVLVWIK